MTAVRPPPTGSGDAAGEAPSPWLIDGRSLRGWSSVRGIGTYLRELLRAWGPIGVLDRVVLLRSRGADRGGDGDGMLARLGSGPALPVLPPRLQPLADPLLVSLAVRRARPALYHGIEWAQPLVTGGVPVVLTIHDLIPFVLAGPYRRLRLPRLPALRLARRSDAVVVPSRATGDDVTRLAGVDPARIHVIPHGVSTTWTPATDAQVAATRERLGVGPGPYLLAVGTFDERKRIDALAAALGRVRRHHDVRLVIAGDQGVYLPRVGQALERGSVDAHTVLAGFVAAPDLAALYSGAAALVFPSAYEGFGLPVLEAMACGTRVVAFDNSCMPEVAGGVADLVGDGDVAALTAAIGTLLAQPEAARAEVVARGRAWAATFTWERSALAHLEVYAAVE